MFCLNCNAALPGNAGVCGRCGMPVNNASPSHPFSQINQAPFPYQDVPMGHPGGPACRQDFPGYSQGPTYPGPTDPPGPSTAQGGPALPYGPAQPFPSHQGPMHRGPFPREATPHGDSGFQPDPSGGHSSAPQSDLGRFQPRLGFGPAPQQPDPGFAQSRPDFRPGVPHSQHSFDPAHSRPEFGSGQPPSDFDSAQPWRGFTTAPRRDLTTAQPSSDFGTASSQSAAHHASSAPQFGSRPAAPFDAYLRRVSSRLQTPFAYLPELSSYLMVTERLSAALANMHQFFFLTQNDACNCALMHQFTSACVSWALHNYQGAPRGMMKGVVVYPVMCQTVANPEVIAFAKQKPETHYSAFTLACSMELSTGRIEWLEKTPVYGFAMWNGVKQAAEAALT